MKRGVAQISDALVGISILFIVMAGLLIPLSNWMNDQIKATLAATQAKRVQQAVNLYIRDKHDTIAASATATNPFIFGVTELINAGYLPTGYSTQNNFSATYQTRVFEPSANKLSSMTFLNGGVNIPKVLREKSQ